LKSVVVFEGCCVYENEDKTIACGTVVLRSSLAFNQLCFVKRGTVLRISAI